MAEPEISTDWEEVLSRHRKEKKHLQAQIMQIKNEVPKGDKKRKKEATEKIACLEAELHTRHSQETEGFKQNEDGVSDVIGGLENLSTQTDNKNPTTQASNENLSTQTSNENHSTQADNKNPSTQADNEKSSTQADNKNPSTQADNENPSTQADNENHKQPKKVSKAQKRREKKSQKDRERNEDIHRQDIENLSGDRHLEAQTFKHKLQALNLAVYEIHSDGNCMYNAIGHQLAFRGVKEDNFSLREKTAAYMRKHPDDYLPFLCKDDTGDLYTPEEFEEYCNKVETTTTWGGQLELRALSDVLHIPIKVLQGTGPDLVIGEEYKELPVTLLYYRHAFGLGEHYNSVRTRLSEDDDEIS